jgi:xanthine dehydrogenase molybdenum-binding subunit
MAGNAALKACEKAKRQILEIAVEKMPKLVKGNFKRKKRKDPEFVEPDLDYNMISGPEKLDIKDRMVFPKAAPDHPYFKFEVSEILRSGLHVGVGESKVVVADAFYDPPTENLDREMKGNLSLTYAFGATGVEVEVDEETGKVKILNLFAAHDVGKAINPTLVKGQVYGAAYMGVGYALTEEMLVENGRVMNPNFRDYKMFTAKDVIPVDPILIETDEKDGPFGAKGIGEPGLVPTAPAIANAIYDAIGVRINDLPITPEKIITALKEKKNQH